MGPNTFVTSVGSNYGQKRGLSKKFIALIAAVLIVVIILITVIANFANRDNLGTQSQHLSAQLTNLLTLTADGKQHLGDDGEQKLNAETAIIVEGIQANLSTTLPKKVDKSVAADESDASATQNLANAVIDGSYDSEYKTVLREKLEATTALLSDMYDKAKSTTLRANLKTSYANLTALLSELNKPG